MTTSLYTESTVVTCIHHDNWDLLIKGISNSCTFVLKEKDTNDTFQKRPIIHFTARYYLKGGMVYIHISNDVRRTLVKYLKKTYGIFFP